MRSLLHYHESSKRGVTELKDQLVNEWAPAPKVDTGSRGVQGRFQFQERHDSLLVDSGCGHWLIFRRGHRISWGVSEGVQRPVAAQRGMIPRWQKPR